MMYFNWNTHLKNLLFFGFDVNTVPGLVATVAIFFSIAFLNEAIKSLRLNVQRKALGKRHNVSHGDHSHDSDDSSDSATLLSQSNQQDPRFKIMDGLLYALQTTLGFGLMLAVMSFSAWIFLAAIFGTTFGNTVFLQRLNSTESFVIISKSSLTFQENMSRDVVSNVPSDDEESIANEEQPNNVITVELHHT